MASGQRARANPGHVVVAQLPDSPRLQLIACDVINPAHINVTFDSIGGLDTVKQALVRHRLLGAGFAVCQLMPRRGCTTARPGHPAAGSA